MLAGGASGRPRSPQGRTTSTIAMTRNSSTRVACGNTTMPKAWTSPTSTAARKAPTMLPMPPMTTTTKTSTMMPRSMDRLAAWRGICNAPPSPAMNAPSTKTEVNRTFWLMPSAPTISRSWVAARTVMPQRVRWNSSHRAPRASGPRTTSISSYSGKGDPRMVTAPSSPGARGPNRSSLPQTVRVRSWIARTRPKVASNWKISGEA